MSLLFARKPQRLDLIVRAAQDRSLADGEKLFKALCGAEALSRSEVRVAPRGPGDKGRVATVELRATSVRIARPSARHATVGGPRSGRTEFAGSPGNQCS